MLLNAAEVKTARERARQAPGAAPVAAVRQSAEAAEAAGDRDQAPASGPGLPRSPEPAPRRPVRVATASMPNLTTDDLLTDAGRSPKAQAWPPEDTATSSGNLSAVPCQIDA